MFKKKTVILNDPVETMEYWVECDFNYRLDRYTNVTKVQMPELYKNLTVWHDGVFVMYNNHSVKRHGSGAYPE